MSADQRDEDLDDAQLAAVPVSNHDTDHETDDCDHDDVDEDEDDDDDDADDADAEDGDLEEPVALAEGTGVDIPAISRKVRRRRRRSRPRSKTIAMKRLTRERIRQVEVRGLLKLKMASPSPDELGADLLKMKAIDES